MTEIRQYLPVRVQRCKLCQKVHDLRDDCPGAAVPAAPNVTRNAVMPSRTVTRNASPAYALGYVVNAAAGAVTRNANAERQRRYRERMAR